MPQRRPAMVGLLAGVPMNGTNANGSGFSNGDWCTAKFDWPAGIVEDGVGNVYIADNRNHCIRKMDTDGVVQTLAGSRVAGYSDGTGTDALFRSPYGMAMDLDGNLLVCDATNHCIRKVSSSGVVTTVAGTGQEGFKDGPACHAMFSHPHALLVLPDGDVLIADRMNHRIRKLSTDGAVSTLAGTGMTGLVDGDAATAEFNRPCGLALNSQRSILVSDGGNHCIRCISPTGEVSSIAGNGDPGCVDGPMEHARFQSPEGILTDGADNIIIADTSNDCVRMITPMGEVSTLKVTSSTSMVPETSCCKKPRGIFLNRFGNLLVTSTEDHRIHIIYASLDLPRPQTRPAGAKLWKNLLYDRSLADIDFVVNGEVITAHRCVLAARNACFQKLFLSGFAESSVHQITVEDTTPVAFHAFLEYLYTDELSLDDHTALGVMQLCQKYIVHDGYSRCFSYCIGHISLANAIPWLVQSYSLDLPEFHSCVMKYVREHLPRILELAPDSTNQLKQHPDLALAIVTKDDSGEDGLLTH